MTVCIVNPRPSESARALVRGIREAGAPCARIKQHIRRVSPGDLLVYWGADPIPHPANVRTLNEKVRINKRQQLLCLYGAGINVPELYDAPGPGRIGRTYRHVGGEDILLNHPPHYWTQKLEIDREFRIHVFRGMSIRAGVKVPRPNVQVHPWVRSYTGGWRLDYGAACQRTLVKGVRSIAKRAVAALGLDFGAVDVGLVRNAPVVLEVNLAPGLDEGPSVDAYVRHILAVYNDR